jgi:hypothetical protein
VFNINTGSPFKLLERRVSATWPIKRGKNDVSSTHCLYLTFSNMVLGAISFDQNIFTE